MSPSVVALMLAMVAGFSVAQLLFKRAAQRVEMVPGLTTLWRLATEPAFVGALVFYGVGTLLYIWILNRLPLSRAYAVFALQFVLVPLLGVLVLGEPASWRLFLGSLLIVVGILFAAGG
jgi:drug/metabolite transporter (DMT)-like permease